MEISFQDKLDHALELACMLCYENDGKVKNTSKYNKELEDLLWLYADGLIQKYHEKRITGLCSLKQMIDYEMEKEEIEIDEHIELFTQLLKAEGR
jgi:hypothetical protein